MKKVLALYFWLLLTASSNSASAEFSHQVWDDLLQSHVRVLQSGEASEIDYAGMLRDRSRLATFLSQTAQVTKSAFESWPETEQLAFLINTYNAWTVELVLTEYPKLNSIKDIGSLFRSPFRQNYIALFGDTVSLDDIEHELIRGPNGYNEPRIHFAVNCASIGCPAMRPAAFIGGAIEQQLEDAIALFLSDRSRNRLDGSTLRVSKVFDWYQEDFEAGWRGSNSLAEFLAIYSDALGLSAQQRQSLLAGDIRIRFLRYDWDLNDIREISANR